MERKTCLEVALFAADATREITSDSLTRKQDIQLNKFSALYGFAVGFGPNVANMAALYGALIVLHDHPKYADMRRLYENLRKERPDIISL